MSLLLAKETPHVYTASYLSSIALSSKTVFFSVHRWGENLTPVVLMITIEFEICLHVYLSTFPHRICSTFLIVYGLGTEQRENTQNDSAGLLDRHCCCFSDSFLYLLFFFMVITDTILYNFYVVTHFLRAFHALFHLLFQKSYKRDNVTIPTSWRRKLNDREIINPSKATNLARRFKHREPNYRSGNTFTFY